MVMVRRMLRARVKFMDKVLELEFVFEFGKPIG